MKPKLPVPVAKLRILQSAEGLFAELGFHGVSLRELARAARVNAAAVNYHFGNMQGVYVDLLSHRLRTLNEQWSLTLERRTASAGRAANLEQILDGLCAPLFETWWDRETGGQNFIRILSRCLAEPLEFVEPLLASQYHTTLARFARAIQTQVKRTSPEDFMWRFSFVIGALHHTLGILHRMPELTAGICQNEKAVIVRKRFIDFSANVFRA